MIAGRYTFEREIGRGGAGVVHLGRDQAPGSTVAIKRLGLLPGTTEDDVARAEREARLAAGINHPHVVSILDLVKDEDCYWLVMEHVEGGRSPRSSRREGPLAPARAAAIIAQAASGLVEANKAGIVHRDVKPSNIMIDADNHAKFGDFGIARSADDAALTKTGLVTGSPAYLAPEVASGAQATAASDVWSLGATLFHAVVGQAPTRWVRTSSVGSTRSSMTTHRGCRTTTRWPGCWPDDGEGPRPAVARGPGARRGHV